MKSKITAALLIAAANVLYSQSITHSTSRGVVDQTLPDPTELGEAGNVELVHPWKVVDNGGGKSTAGGITLQASIGQPAVQAGSAPGFHLEEGYIPGLRIVAGTVAQVQFSVTSGWNMVSAPMIVNDYRRTVLFPTAISPAYYFFNGYLIRDTLRRGEGYWIKFPGLQAIQMTGTALAEDSIGVNAGWNMVGSISYPILSASVTAVPPISILSGFYGFQTGTGYYVADTIKPGSAYWVKVSGAGRIVMRSGSLLLTSQPQGKKMHSGFLEADDREGINTLTVRDAEGNERTLYFSSTRTDLDAQSFELPPTPPEGILDVRYDSQRYLEVARTAEVTQFPIRIRGANFPVTLRWEVAEPEEQYSLEIVYAGQEPVRHQVQGSGSLVIERPDVLTIRLLMAARSVPGLPKEYALQQNYPNPFNPSTTIRFELPRRSSVELSVFNILGQKVATLLKEERDAGRYSLVWHGTNDEGLKVGSGVYFYRIRAEDGSGTRFVETKKLLLLK